MRLLCQIVSENKQNVKIDYALDSKELHKNFVPERAFQHSAVGKAMFPACPVLSSCWANGPISSWSSGARIWLMEPASPPFLMASSHCDFNQNIAGNPSWGLSGTTSIAIFYILLLKKRKAKEMSPRSKAEINRECEASIALSSQKGATAIR